MKIWLADNWYVVWGILATLGVVAWRVGSDKRDLSLGQRLRFALMPQADPDVPSSLTPRAIVFVVIGLLLVGIVSFLLG
jgi:hypothetical protein